MRTIEAQTGTLQAVPLPSSPPAPETDSLPRPSAAGDDLTPITPAATGWKQRLREWLRR
jgi:hypothetical protein